ncbi:hypothetical protein ACOKV8_000546 [Vibrio parahaemolyticus]
MKRNLLITSCLVAISLSGCSTWKIPSTQGDPNLAESYGYNPIDSLPVRVEPSNATLAQKLEALPDETMRLAIGQFDGKAGLSFGPATTGVAGNRYVVILDYTKFTTESFGVKTTPVEDNKLLVSLTNDPNPDVVVPVYVGVGLRLTAHVTVKEGSVDLGNLFALGVAAQAKQISGTLVIQSLGLSGEGVSPLIPIPSEINPTTVQNALMAIGAIKAKLYDGKITVVPRVVGVYNNLGGGQETINGFISTILQEPLTLETQ